MGIIVLLLGVALIVLFIVRTDLFYGKAKSLDSAKDDLNNAKGILEEGMDAINQAREVKYLLEQKNQLLPE